MTTTIRRIFMRSMVNTRLYKAVISIQDLAILEGDLPPKAVGLVMEWGRAYKNDLLRDWDLARKKKSLFPIEPLE